MWGNWLRGGEEWFWLKYTNVGINHVVYMRGDRIQLARNQLVAAHLNLMVSGIPRLPPIVSLPSQHSTFGSRKGIRHRSKGQIPRFHMAHRVPLLRNSFMEFHGNSTFELKGGSFREQLRAVKDTANAPTSKIPQDHHPTGTDCRIIRGFGPSRWDRLQ